MGPLEEGDGSDETKLSALEQWMDFALVVEEKQSVKPAVCQLLPLLMLIGQGLQSNTMSGGSKKIFGIPTSEQ